MQFRLVSVAAALAACRFVHAEERHGEGSEGTVMGPVAFLWPDDRKYVPNRHSHFFRTFRGSEGPDRIS